MRSIVGFKFKSVRTKLLASFGVVALLLALVGFTGVTSENAISHDAWKGYNRVTLPLEQLATMRANVLQARLAATAAIIEPTSAGSAKQFGLYAADVANVAAAEQSFHALADHVFDHDIAAFDASW